MRRTLTGENYSLFSLCSSLPRTCMELKPVNLLLLALVDAFEESVASATLQLGLRRVIFFFSSHWLSLIENPGLATSLSTLGHTAVCSCA